MSNGVQATVDKEAEGKTQEIISNNCPQRHIPSDPLLQSLQNILPKFYQMGTKLSPSKFVEDPSISEHNGAQG